MVALIYNDLFKVDHASASLFRKKTMYALNGAMDAIERGDFNNDYHTT